MIIPCPYCGPRDLSEFAYQGDATRTRPDPSSTDEAAWQRWVYERKNPAGWHREFWQHSGGCRAHLVVERNTLTHEIGKVALARDAHNAAPAPGRPVPKEQAVAPAVEPSPKAEGRPVRPRKPAATPRKRTAPKGTST
ncbi:sarcosine oxidase subunit delta [Chelativorans sp. ZYF759]|nr:sarcosine oxidase subunit delta [Chelativorans sp. ZYF759]